MLPARSQNFQLGGSRLRLGHSEHSRLLTFPDCTCFHAALVAGVRMPVAALVTGVAGAPSARMLLAPGGPKGRPEAASAAPLSTAPMVSQHRMEDRQLCNEGRTALL